MVLSLSLLITAIPPVTANAEGTPEVTFSQEKPFVMTEDENGIHFKGMTGGLINENYTPVNVISDKEDYLKYTQKSFLKPLIKSSVLPKSVDNSNTKYFPEIGNQGSLGTCAFWAGIYYQFTYEMNRARNVEASYETSYSPSFAYNVVNKGYHSGAFHYEVFDFLMLQGCATLGTVPYNEENIFDWHANEEAWRESIRSRMAGYQDFADIGTDDTQITSVNDSDLEAIKTALANGDVLTYSTEIDSWNYTRLTKSPYSPENSKYFDEYAVVNQIGHNGPHRMTLVGYNDNIWIDVNENNTIDSGEMGAFKVANSWSDSYCNDGFVWIAYDALNRESSVKGAVNGEERERILREISRIDVKPYNEGADTYLKLTLNTSDRSEMRIKITGESNGKEDSYRFLNEYFYTGSLNQFAFDGGYVATDGTLVIALDAVCPELTAENLHEYTFDVEISDVDDDSDTLTVKDVQIVNDGTGQTYKAGISSPIKLNGNSVNLRVMQSDDNNKVVYYIGYENPTLHYKRGNGSWQTVKMDKTLERQGYLYKHIIRDVDENVALYFTDENGNTDNNSGSNYVASERLNFYRTKEAGQPIIVEDITFDHLPCDIQELTYFDTILSGGYAPYKFKYTVEDLQTGEISVYDYDNELKHYFPAEGNYRLTVDVLDFANDVVTFTKEFYFEDIPFKFSELKPIADKLFVGESIKFKAMTQFESVIAFGDVYSSYDFVIKDSSGKICYTNSKRFDVCDMEKRTSTTYLEWTPEKSGTYTITVSSTDANNDYAEKTIEFKVNSKLCGDADCDGIIGIKDVTEIQKYIADYEDVQVIMEVSDCDGNKSIDIKDVTLIQKYIAQCKNCGNVGKNIDEIKKEEEPTTVEPTTVEPTTVEPTTVEPTTVPDDRRTIYFEVSEDWQKDNAWFAMYSWDGNGNEVFTRMNEIFGGYYTAKLDEGYSNVIFCRMDANTSECQWSNVWNQSTDLVVPSDCNCFKINNGEWTGANGTWSFIEVA